jgi:hypothetical protein
LGGLPHRGGRRSPAARQATQEIRRGPRGLYARVPAADDNDLELASIHGEW